MQDIEKMLSAVLTAQCGKTIAAASHEEIYEALLTMVKKIQRKNQRAAGARKLYYISAEFLIGKLLANNLINLGLYAGVRETLAQHGKQLSEIEAIEPEPSLGNGGLGRLAACFLDSLATLGLCGDGVGLNYHYGLFRQKFAENRQIEQPDPWLRAQSWLTETNVHFEVPFGGFSVRSTMYDIGVTGYGGRVNRLHLFDLDTRNFTPVTDGIHFDKTDFAHNLTLFLYPDDSDEDGKLLRIYQQYFMVSNAAQLIVHELAARGFAPQTLDRHAVVQINDTHPSLVIPELIRLLTARGVSFDAAVEIVTRTCAYTNHTILAEALETWPLAYLEKAVPHLVPIILALDARAKALHPNPAVAIVDNKGYVHMAHMDIHYGFSVNGVAALHTNILKQSELRAFYDIYPNKFNNKTNGVTFRRWLMYANPALSNFITQLIGGGWKKDAVKLEKLLAYQNDAAVLMRLYEIKQQNKQALRQYLALTQQIDLDENAIFDIQIKRLHAYKRQQMNALYAIYKYFEIKAGHIPKTPLTMIFGAKAAPAYTLAKDIIHVILCLQQLIEADPAVRAHLRVVMIENYNVTAAEKLIPACDISEQISLASKEASGTGNMKFMLNGAVTLGTMDGANVEIHGLVGDANMYLFGRQSEEVIALYAANSYRSKDYYEKDPLVARLVDFLTGDEMAAVGDAKSLNRVQRDLLEEDWFMTLLDLRAYIETKERALADYADKPSWAKKMLVNIAKAGYFSADRTIAQYNADIWKL